MSTHPNTLSATQQGLTEHLNFATTRILQSVPDTDQGRDECEDCNELITDCQCAHLCPWDDYDGAGSCRLPKDDQRDSYCREHGETADRLDALDGIDR